MSYKIGAARIFFKATGTFGYLDFGNIPNTELQNEIENIEHKSFNPITRSMQLDESVAMSQKRSISFPVDNLRPANLDVLMSGNGVTTVDQSSGSESAAVYTAPTVLGNLFFTTYLSISSVVIKDATDTTTYVDGTDYEIVNPAMGQIKVLESGSITSEEVLHLDCSYADVSLRKVLPGASASLTGAARIDYTDKKTTEDMIWTIGKCSLRANGAITIASENYAAGSLILDVLMDKNAPQGEEYGVMKLRV